MKVLKILLLFALLLTQIWIGYSLHKISSVVVVRQNRRNEFNVKTEAAVSGDVMVSSHNFTPHWK